MRDLTVAHEALIPLGSVVNVHATHGEIRMRPFNPDSATLSAGCSVVLRRGGEVQERRLSAVRRH